MCGIAGYFGKTRRTDGQIQECLRRMQRRGPDHSAACHSRSPSGHEVHLLHSRLGIIDLEERSNQPFRLGSRVMVFNGEIYNYLELREELRKAGHAFVTESDTEVLFKWLVEKGWEGLDACEGMWAFAVYDEKDGSLLLSRDRFGEKPLYLLNEEDGFYFGSEVKFIQVMRGGGLTVNQQHLYRYLINGYKALYKTRDCFYSEISEVPSGSVMMWNPREKAKCQRYWKPSLVQDEGMSFAGAVEEAREALIRSVKLRLRADVPLAFCMSGGVDSNALISIAKRKLNYDVHGFTVVDDDPRYDERPVVEPAVRELGIRHTQIPVSTKNFLPRLKDLILQHDAPVYTITWFAQWSLMESIRQHGYKISISGTGADELFSGYYDHHLFYLQAIQGDAGLYEKSLKAWERDIHPVVKNPFLGNPRLFIDRADFRDHIFLDAEAFSKYLKKDWKEPFAEEACVGQLMRNRMLNELFHECVPPLLHEDDLNSMYYSIENRSPYLDRGLFDFCQRIPTRHLVRDGAAKAVLREAVRGLVPDIVLDNKRKVGFNASIHSYLDVKDPKVREALLDESPIFDHVRRDRIEELISRTELPNSESKFLFYFVNSKIFLENGIG